MNAAELARYGRCGAGPRATPIRRADPQHNDLLRDSYPLRAGAEFGAALAMCAVAGLLVIVLIAMAVAR